MPHTPLLLQIKMALTGTAVWGSSAAAVVSVGAACVAPFMSTRTLVGLAAGEWVLIAVGFVALMVLGMCALAHLQDRDEAIRDEQIARARR